MPAMKRRLMLMAAGLLALGCHRTEEPQNAPPIQSVSVPKPAHTDTAAGSSAASTPSSKPRCVLPTPAEPPPEAHAASHCPKDPTGPLDLQHGYVTFVDAPGSPRAAVELARDDASRERGLMYRTSMPENQGMLFSWNNEEIRTFWMHNTCIPLDMLFISGNDLIVGVLEQVPTLNDDSRTVPCPAAYVLELNAGWARSHGVKAGQHVHIEP
jgi:uncharacterized protein